MGGSSGNGCQVAIFASQCASCHSAGGHRAGGLDLASPNPETRMVGKMGGHGERLRVHGHDAADRELEPSDGRLRRQDHHVDAALRVVDAVRRLCRQPADQACLTSWATIVANMPPAFGGEETP